MTAYVDRIGKEHGSSPSSLLAPQQAPLRDLLSQSAQGDQRAFAAVFDATAPRIYGLILQILDGSVDRAVEVTKDVFIEIWQTCGRCDEERPLKWMLIIAGRHARQACSDPARPPPTQPRHAPISRWRDQEQRLVMPQGRWSCWRGRRDDTGPYAWPVSQHPPYAAVRVPIPTVMTPDDADDTKRTDHKITSTTHPT